MRRFMYLVYIRYGKESAEYKKLFQHLFYFVSLDFVETFCFITYEETDKTLKITLRDLGRSCI